MKTAGVQYLEACFSDDTRSGTWLIGWGKLCHTHLFLALLSYLTHAKWDVVDEHANSIYACDIDGFLDHSAVAGNDGGSAELLKHGLLMEVLSYKIYLEQPDACIVISNAMNSPHQWALRATELHAMATLSGEIMLHMNSAVAGGICYRTVKERVRAQLDALVDDPAFKELFGTVVS